MLRDNETVEMAGRMSIALDVISRCREFARMIPEVRTNLVYSRKSPKDEADVLAVNGRMTVVDGAPHPCGPIRFGASSHMARFIIRIHKEFPKIRAGINFANDSQITEFLKDYCSKRGWSLIGIDRSKEPESLKEAEGGSVPWKAEEVIKKAKGKTPKIVYETGAIGKEPVSALLGEDPISVADEVCELARAYGGYGVAPPRVGKVSGNIIESLILKKLGKPSDRVLVPPMTGVDAGVIDIGGGNVLVIAEDPIFSIPGFPLDFLGWATVHIGASDVAVMGVRPQFMTYSLLMPPGTSDADMTIIVDSIHSAAIELGISIVGGHTGTYPGIQSPTIGGVTVLSVAPSGTYVTPAGARPGDEMILTKGPAIEAAGALAMISRDELSRKYGEAMARKAVDLCKRMTVVKDATLAKEAGGVTAMHDATEGGVIGGLYEMAHASGVGMEIDESKFVYPDEVRMVCEHFGMDPVAAIAEGSLLIAARPGSSTGILRALKGGGIPASVIGKATRDKSKRVMRRRDGSLVDLHVPEQDPFWPIFFGSLTRLQR